MDDKALVERLRALVAQCEPLWKADLITHELDAEYSRECRLAVPQLLDTIEALQSDLTRQMDIATEYVNKCEAQATRIEALEAALREVFIHGHSEGWRGNQMRRDVKHEDAEKSWSLYVSNGALEKTIARKALEGKGNG